MYGAGRLGSGHSVAGAQSKSLGQFTLKENETARASDRNLAGHHSRMAMSPAPMCRSKSPHCGRFQRDHFSSRRHDGIHARRSRARRR